MKILKAFPRLGGVFSLTKIRRECYDPNVKKLLLILSIILILPILGIVIYAYWEDWHDYKGYGDSISVKLASLEETRHVRITAAELFGPNWQTACLMVGLPYQYQEAEYQWLSNMLGEQIDYNDTPTSFMDDGGVSMVAFVRTPGGLVKEAGFRAQNWSILEAGNIECTRSGHAEITYQAGMWHPNFEYKFNVYSNEIIQP